MKYKNEITGIGVLICIWIMVAVSCILVFINSAELIGIYILLGFGGVMTIIYIPSLIKTLKIRKEYKNIIVNGIKIQGRIVNYSIDTYSFTGENIRNYSVVVTYIDPCTGNEKQISTPPLSFDPIKSLGDTSCSVYILNGLYYVTDFVPRKSGQDNIWGKEINILEKKN